MTCSAEQGLAWTLLAVAVLGLGIMLGAYWAYGVLGWGGYWGWDPVENSSLVPWLTGIALVHTLLAQRRTGKYQRSQHPPGDRVIPPRHLQYVSYTQRHPR